MADFNKFMIVDENSNNALFWEMSLKEFFPEMETVVCKTGYEALDEAKKGKFDFFIASWELKPMSGLIFMQKLREIYKFKHTPFLIFSQVLQEESISLAQEFGIKNYLLKPFDKQRLVDKVKEMIDEETNLDQIQRTLRKVEDWIFENKINEALKMINDCLKPGPHLARAYTLSGDIWVRTEHFDKAEKAYNDALKHDDAYIHAFNGLAKLYLKQKKYVEASKQFELLNQKSPHNVGRLIQLGNVYLGAGQEDKAEEIFKNVKSLDDENQDASAGLGKVAFSKGNLVLAARFFKESGKGDELATYFNNMGITLVNSGKASEAINLYKNAINVLPDRTKAHLLEFNIGLAYKKTNKFGDAVDAFSRSLLLNPTFEKSYSGLALCLKEAKNQNLSYTKALVQQAVDRYKESKLSNNPAENETPKKK